MELCFRDVPNSFLTGVLGPCHADSPLCSPLAFRWRVWQPLRIASEFPRQLGTVDNKTASVFVSPRKCPRSERNFPDRHIGNFVAVSFDNSKHESSPAGVRVRELR